MKIMIYGSNGWIGKQFIEICNNYKNIEESKTNLNIIKGKSRLDNLNDVEQEINEIKPDRVISFTGRTHGITEDGIEYKTIDYLEQSGKLVENIRDNLFSVVMLALLCKEKDIHYTYLGTGCIFKYFTEFWGKEQNGFKESSEPNFFGSSYSIVKGFTDRIMKSNLLSNYVLNLRIRMPITSKCEPRNFITKITRYNKICSIPNSMTVLDELLPLLLDLVIKKKTGTINFTNPGLITHNEILTMYKKYVDPTFMWQNFTQEEQLSILDADRSNNYLDTEKLELYYPDILHIKDAIKKCLIKYSEHWKTLSDSEKYYKYDN
jgi:3,5-epimerase/4-reductase